MHAFWTAVKFRHEHSVEMPSPIKTGALLDMKQGITLKHTWSLQGYLVLFKITSLDVTLHLSPHSCVHGSVVEPVNMSLPKCRHTLVYLGNEKLEDRQHLRKLQCFNIWVVWYLCSLHSLNWLMKCLRGAIFFQRLLCKIAPL